VNDFGDEIDSRELLDVSLDKRRIHSLGTGIDLKFVLEVASVILENLVQQVLTSLFFVFQ